MMRELKLKEQELTKLRSQEKKVKKKRRKQQVSPKATLKPLPSTTKVWICQIVQQLQNTTRLVKRQASYLAAVKIVPQVWVLHQAVSREGRTRGLAGLEETEQFRTPGAACHALTLLVRLLHESGLAGGVGQSKGEEDKCHETPAINQETQIKPSVNKKSIAPWRLEANMEAALQNVIKSQEHKSSSCKTEPQSEVHCDQNDDYQVEGEDREKFFASHVMKVGPKAFKCNICGKSASTLHNAKTHVENKHFAWKFINTCKICGLNLNSRTALDQHLRSHVTT